MERRPGLEGGDGTEIAEKKARLLEGREGRK